MHSYSVSPVPRIAIALAAYNGIDFISEQVDSILRQTGVNVCIFISVDKSIDGTDLWVSESANRDSRIKLLEYGAVFGGASANFFRLLRDVNFDNFDYLAFSDQDDIWQPDKLFRAVYAMHLHGSDAYSSNVTAFWPSGRKQIISKSQPQTEWDHLFEAAGPGCTYVMKLRLVRELQAVVTTRKSFLAKITFHDWFTYAYARSHGYFWHIDVFPGLMYRQHSANQIGANAGWRSFTFRMLQIWSGEAFEQLRLVVDAVDLPSNHPVRVLLSSGAFGLIKLAFLSHRCRRKGSDRVVFFLACMLGAFRTL